MTTREYMAKKLHEYRIAKGYSVDVVGAKIGKSGKTISAWEVGRGQPDADKLVELCNLYGVRIADFYSDDVTQGVSLENDETNLLEAYRELNEEGKRMALSVLAALAKSGDYSE